MINISVLIEIKLQHDNTHKSKTIQKQKFKTEQI